MFNPSITDRLLPSHHCRDCYFIYNTADLVRCASLLCTRRRRQRSSATKKRKSIWPEELVTDMDDGNSTNSSFCHSWQSAIFRKVFLARKFIVTTSGQGNRDPSTIQRVHGFIAHDRHDKSTTTGETERDCWKIHKSEQRSLSFSSPFHEDKSDLDDILQGALEFWKGCKN